MINIGYGDLEAYTGHEPLTFTSPLFSVKLSQGDTILFPHVYYDEVNNTRYNCPKGNNLMSSGWDNYHNRTISWIEYGQKESDTTMVDIVYIGNNTNPSFNDSLYPVQIFPLSYNIRVDVSTDYKSISFNITGNYKSISVEFGNYSVGNKLSNYMNSLMIFVGDISPKINISASNVIYFLAGVHNITKQNGYKSILNVPQTVDTIYFQRGSFVYGKINDTANIKGRLKILGYGILSGSYFEYCDRWSTQRARASMIESNRSTTIHGLTIYDPSWFMTQNQLPPNSLINSLKGIPFSVFFTDFAFVLLYKD